MSNPETLPIVFRPIAYEDKAFIFNSWLKSFRNGFMVKNVDNTIYFLNHHKIVDSCTTKGTTIICCDAQDSRIIYGYICFEHIEGQFVLHYIYIKEVYRKLGLGKMLLEKTGHDFNILGCYTHQTPVALKHEANYNLVYHPYLIFNRG